MLNITKYGAVYEIYVADLIGDAQVVVYPFYSKRGRIELGILPFPNERSKFIDWSN